MSIFNSIAIPFKWLGEQLEDLNYWLFTEEERQPIGFIYVFFLSILISTLMCSFILSVVGIL